VTSATVPATSQTYYYSTILDIYCKILPN
jgi:DNA-binding transcriptional regulator YbjK